jgi:hypothetical protein
LKKAPPFVFMLYLCLQIIANTLKE